jgi:hypothetical protein
LIGGLRLGNCRPKEKIVFDATRAEENVRRIVHDCREGRARSRQ